MHFLEKIFILKFQRIDLWVYLCKNTPHWVYDIYVSMLSMYQLSFNGSTFRIYKVKLLNIIKINNKIFL